MTKAVSTSNGNGKSRSPFIVGVSGGSASGKTSVCNLVYEALGNPAVIQLSQDSFYKPLTPEQRADVANYDFDHPNAFDYDLIEKTLDRLHRGLAVDVPIYDFATHSRLKETTHVEPADIIMFEGILCFFTKAIRDQFNMKIFVDVDSDTRLARRVQRDIAERGRDLGGVLHQYMRFVKPAFEDYILPTKKYADVIVPRGADNVVAIDLIAQHIRSKLIERGVSVAPVMKIQPISKLLATPDNQNTEVPAVHVSH